MNRLNIYKNYFDFEDIFKKLKSNDDFYNLNLEITAPVLVFYVSHILNHAQKNNVKRLYFLARDGFPMYEVAKILCKNYEIDIDLRYLCCSRLSLKPPFLAIDFEKSLREICVKSTSTTYFSILEACGLSSKLSKIILNKLNIPDGNSLISKIQIDEFYNNISNNTELSTLFVDNSQQKLQNIEGYFEKEGLYEDLKFALVDSGWSGTMQSAISDILTQKKKNIDISGYYFGLYKDLDESKFNSYLFSPKNNFSRAYTFNNNLFESICSANHGMTTSYDDNFNPIFRDFTTDNSKLHMSILDFANEFCENFELPTQDLCLLSHQILKSLMQNPTKLEAELFGSIRFCDDPSENSLTELASYLSPRDFKKNYFFSRIIANFIKSKKTPESFWLIGTAKRFYPRKTWFCKINFTCVQFVYYKIKNAK